MAKLKLTKKLNLVIPIDTEKGIGYVHSVPISREVFETNYLVLSTTFMELYSKRLGPILGPKVALCTLKDQAKALTPRVEEGDTLEPEDDVWAKTENSLIKEIHRLSTVAIPKDSGYDTLPYGQAIQQDLLDEDTISEVENALVYFTVASRLHKKEELPIALKGIERQLNARTTLLSITEYINSLKTLTKVENTGETTLALVPKV